MAKKPESFYRQSGVIPYRFHDARLEILLITSLKRKRWIIPKGIVEPDLTPAQSAAQEAEEEAGISGEVSAEPLGTYKYAKWGGTCHVEVFSMRVTSVLEQWQERGHRERRWFPVDEAAARVREKVLKSMMLQLPERARRPRGT